MSIQQKINESLKEEQGKKSGRSSGKWSPSLFGRCYRAQYWKRKSEPPSNLPDERALRIFRVGDIFHDFVKSFFDDATSEVKVESDDILGYADLVTDEEVIDIKSQHSRAFWWMKQEGYNIEEKKLGNILQIMCYVWLLKKPKGRLVFVSKDDLCIAEYVFFFEKWKDRLQHELDILQDYWHRDELPSSEPRAYKNNKGMSNEKKYCPYRDKCGEECGQKNIKENISKTGEKAIKIK